MNNSAIRNGLGYVTLALMVAALFMVFDYVPPEAEQGIAQLIFYFHVPLAWVAFASFGLVAIAGVSSTSGSAISCGTTWATPPPKPGWCSAR